MSDTYDHLLHLAQQDGDLINDLARRKADRMVTTYAWQTAMNICGRTFMTEPANPGPALRTLANRITAIAQALDETTP